MNSLSSFPSKLSLQKLSQGIFLSSSIALVGFSNIHAASPMDKPASCENVTANYSKIDDKQEILAWHGCAEADWKLDSTHQLDFQLQPDTHLDLSEDVKIDITPFVDLEIEQFSENI